MAVPDFQSFFRPTLEILEDGREYRWRDTREAVADALQISPEDRADMVPSGVEPRYVNRATWAVTYLSKAGLVTATRRGHGQITDRGLALLRQRPGKIMTADLDQFSEFLAFRTGKPQPDSHGAAPQQTNPASSAVQEQSPDEQLDALYATLSATLADELLTQVRALTPQQFEILVVQLLVAMGYGGSVRDAGEALGRSGDNGIDGVVKQDPLGLDKVYIQAKQWTSNVGSQEVRNFSGSLTYHSANKGVLLTTAGFSPSALDTARQIGNIILIGGDRLADLMIQYDVGVITRSTYQVKKIDSDFFEGI